jgi:hypothetical protein
LVAHLQQESQTQTFPKGRPTECHPGFTPWRDRSGLTLKLDLRLHLSKLLHSEIRIVGIIVKTLDDLPSLIITPDAEKPTRRKW